ncbi:hypothetical protein AVEN_230130-1 [Araneus ventricosus]|uniref:Uncharacterized protein n=1 Tax=Araneus ventricosus TaxID=182803 RepID=A0A4Y2IH15_ARAVE|nr:hypothetical protein AVEN_230130-1 [Araneus ventricosus]
MHQPNNTGNVIKYKLAITGPYISHSRKRRLSLSEISEERQGGGAYIGASEKLGPSHGSSEKNRSLVVASREDLEPEWRRVKL